MFLSLSQPTQVPEFTVATTKSLVKLSASLPSCFHIRIQFSTLYRIQLTCSTKYKSQLQSSPRTISYSDAEISSPDLRFPQNIALANCTQIYTIARQTPQKALHYYKMCTTDRTMVHCRSCAAHQTTTMGLTVHCDEFWQTSRCPCGHYPTTQILVDATHCHVCTKQSERLATTNTKQMEMEVDPRLEVAQVAGIEPTTPLAKNGCPPAPPATPTN